MDEPNVVPGTRVQRLSTIVAPAAVGFGVAALYSIVAVVTWSHSAHSRPPFLQWDGGWYLQIAQHGYVHSAGAQQPYEFFPLMPLLTTGVQWLLPFFGIGTWGFILHLLAIGANAFLVDRILASWPRWQRLLTVTFVLSIPGAVFYVAFYSESFFVLGVLLTIWALVAPGRMKFAPVGVAIATLARAPGFLMMVPVVITLLARRQTYGPRFIAAITASSLAGTVVILVFFAAVAGDPLAFLHARSGWNDFTNASFVTDFFKSGWSVRRYISVGLRFHSFFAVSIGLWMDLLMPVLVVVSWFWNRAFAVGAALLYLASIFSGGIDSQARYMLVILPAWIGAVWVLRRYRPLWPALGVLTCAGIGINVYLAWTFSSGGWAG